MSQTAGIPATAARRQSAMARRESLDILDRLTVPPRPNVPPVLTERQAAAGRLLRMYAADAEVSVRTTWDLLEDRVDVSPGPRWGPPGTGGSDAALRWLRLMERTLGAIDCAICVAVAIQRKEPRELFEVLRGNGFLFSRREVNTHIRRAFEALRRFCDGA